MSIRKVKLEIESFANDIYTSFYRNITDQMFLYIQNNEELLFQYDLLEAKYTKEILNQDLGLLFKELFNVENLERNYNPESDLINSYTQHTTPKK